MTIDSTIDKSLGVQKHSDKGWEPPVILSEEDFEVQAADCDGFNGESPAKSADPCSQIQS